LVESMHGLSRVLVDPSLGSTSPVRTGIEMMSASLPACIVLTTQQWFEECLRRGCTVLHFPPNRNPRGINKLNNGSICLILAKSRSGAPRMFLGELTVKNVKRVRGEEFHVYASRAVIVEEVPSPKLGESSWIIEFESLTRYRRPVKLAECDVRTSTSRKPLKDWAILGFTFIKSEDAGKVVGYVRNLAGVEVGEREVTSRSEGRVKGGIVTGEREVRISDLEKLLVLHLIAGKNVIVLGPPGSGKTGLVKDLCESLGVKCNIATGNPEWTPFDTIGGYSVDGGFRAGFITNSVAECLKSLRSSDRPVFLIIDEINRANVDLAFGPLFTLLDVSHRDSPLLTIERGRVSDLSVLGEVLDGDRLYVPYSFRILATMNSYDRALLFKLGYALLRRFAVVEMRRDFRFEPNPEDWVNKAREWLSKRRVQCSLSNTVKLDLVERELLLSRPQLNDYAPLDPILHNELSSKRIKGALEELATNEGFSSWDELWSIITSIACSINEKLVETNVEVTEALLADVIKFLVASRLLNESLASNHLKTLLDEALSSYVVPQLDILADRVRAEG
jgi:predicted transcriptional regulator